MSQNEPSEKLIRYQPREISKVQWDLARGEAVMAVMECKVETVETARTLIGHLARFLIWHLGWDRRTAPDFNALVTANFIETYCGNPSTPPTERPYLRRVARAIGTMPPLDSYKRSPKRLAVRPFWSSVCDLGSFVGLAAAYQSLGYGLASVGFGALVDQGLIAEWDLDQLIACTASAPSERLGTIPSVVRAAVNLRGAPDVEPMGVRAIQNVKSKSDQGKIVKPLSRTAAVKGARTAQALRSAAAEALIAGTPLEPRLGNLPALAHVMAVAISGFRPNQFTDSQWELVADATRQLATAYDPSNVKWVHTQMGVLARFCRWAAARPARGTSTDPLRPAELLVEGLVEEYLAGPLATVPDGTRATVRSVLHRALRRLAPDLAPRVISYQPVQPPYTAYECASWVRLEFSAGYAPDLTDVEREIRSETLQAIIDKLIRASHPQMMPKKISIAWDSSGVESFGKPRWAATATSEAVDADLDDVETTMAELQAVIAETKATKGKTKKGKKEVRQATSFDRDAHLGYRTKTHDNKSTKLFGYDLFAGVAVLPIGADPDDMPKLLLSMTLRPAASDTSDPTLDSLDRLVGEGYENDELLVDRGFSYKRPEDWAMELHKRGISQVQDIHAADRGVKDYEGIRIIRGLPYCVETLDELIDNPPPQHFKVGPLRKKATAEDRLSHEYNSKTLEEFLIKNEKLQQYAFVLKQNVPSKSDPFQTEWICPGRAGKLNCALCPLSEHYPSNLPVVEDPGPLATAPKCCRQATIVIPGPVLVKLRQRDPWGSPKWIGSFVRRGAIEGIFGNLRNQST